MMKMKPFKEVLKLTKEGLDAALAPIRARQVKTKAELEMSKLEEKMVSLEAKAHELCTTKEIDFDALLKTLDEFALAERRIKQYKQVLSELFPGKE